MVFGLNQGPGNVYVQPDPSYPYPPTHPYKSGAYQALPDEAIADSYWHNADGSGHVPVTSRQSETTSSSPANEQTTSPPIENITMSLNDLPSEAVVNDDNSTTESLGENSTAPTMTTTTIEGPDQQSKGERTGDGAALASGPGHWVYQPAPGSGQKPQVFHNTVDPNAPAPPYYGGPPPAHPDEKVV